MNGWIVAGILYLLGVLLVGSAFASRRTGKRLSPLWGIIWPLFSFAALWFMATEPGDGPPVPPRGRMVD